jgi:threonine synthase
MHYFSTNRRSPRVSFRDAVLSGQPDDKGLYFPEEMPRLSDEFLATFHNISNADIAFEIIRPFTGDSIPDDILFEICAATVDFSFPVVRITENISALELFHGPTLAFKDVGARFMSRCLGYFSRDESRRTLVVVATSGDTGGAVANGFFGVDGVDVIILYPKNKVSRVQELQLTTLGGNITAVEIEGTFDDCQDLAKRALADNELKQKARVTSANSINVARWLPQQFYYFFALKQWSGEPPVISVPSGNFGNLAAGILANVRGLPVKKFVAACNANDVVPRFMRTCDLEPRSAIATLSNAMDVGNPSNFVRILEIFENVVHVIKDNVEAVSISDECTAETMREVFQNHSYVLDPHGAVGYRALADYLAEHPEERGIFLETAHPVKFESVERIVGTYGDVPESINELLLRKKESVEMDVDYQELRDLLMSKV